MREYVKINIIEFRNWIFVYLWEYEYEWIDEYVNINELEFRDWIFYICRYVNNDEYANMGEIEFRDWTWTLYISKYVNGKIESGNWIYVWDKLEDNNFNYICLI